MPGNCTIDQVYWSPDPSKIPEECHVIGQRGPCSIDQVISRDLTGLVSCLVPTEKNLAEAKTEQKVKSEGKAQIQTNVENNTEIDVETNTEINTEISIEKTKTEPKKESKKETVNEEVVVPSPWDRPGCPLGSYRSQTNKCSKQFP